MCESFEVSVKRIFAVILVKCIFVLFAINLRGGIFIFSFFERIEFHHAIFNQIAFGRRDFVSANRKTKYENKWAHYFVSRLEQMLGLLATDIVRCFKFDLIEDQKIRPRTRSDA